MCVYVCVCVCVCVCVFVCVFGGAGWYCEASVLVLYEAVDWVSCVVVAVSVLVLYDAVD